MNALSTNSSFARVDLAHPSISVVLCVHQSNEWLSSAIQSILNQTYSDFEFLIAANACNDDLWNELHSIAGSDPRVKLYRTKIGQLPFNLNFLTDYATGDYLVRMDADDISEPNRIEILRKELIQDPVDILGSAVILINSCDEEVGKMVFPLSKTEICHAISLRTVFCHPSIAIRRSFLMNLRGYLGGFYSEDTDLWLRAVRANASMRNILIPLLRYRIHDTQSISSKDGYAEVAGYWLRELLIKPSWFTTKGFSIALLKALFSFLLPGIRRYKQ